MSAARPMRVGLLGAGTVGREVARAFAAAPERLATHDGPRIELVGVAVRDLARARAAGIDPALLTDAPAHLVAAPETDVIVELMGGDEPARTLIAAALGAGKPVVTANKHVLAHHGPELEAIARRSGVALRFEASVAGGIPVLGPLADALAADRVRGVRGIVNGTTNYILSAMALEGRSYDDVLADAQAAGYAEADPAGDVEGDDAVNKLVILIRLAFGTWLSPGGIARRPATADPARPGRPGITGISPTDIAGAAALGAAIKLVADARRLDDGRIVAAVLPTVVAHDDRLARTDGILNRVEILSDGVGMVAVEGPGAGGAATASAVLADLRAVGRGRGSTWAGLPPAGVAPPQAQGGTPEEAGDWFAVVGPNVDSAAFDAPSLTAEVDGGTAVILRNVALGAARARFRAIGLPMDGIVLPVAPALSR